MTTARDSPSGPDYAKQETNDRFAGKESETDQMSIPALRTSHVLRSVTGYKLNTRIVNWALAERFSQGKSTQTSACTEARVFVLRREIVIGYHDWRGRIIV